MFDLGDRVLRVEGDRRNPAAVIAVEDVNGGKIYELAYDEGGTGWWPEDTLEPEE